MWNPFIAFRAKKNAPSPTVRTEFDPEEFISDPSPASQVLIDIVKKHTEYYNALFASKNPVRIFQREVGIRVYIQEDYKGFYAVLKTFSVGANGHSRLQEEFDTIYKQIIYNNIAIAYLHAKGEQIQNTYQTTEDSKNILLQQIAHGKKRSQDLRDRFGHYSLEPFEITSKRFTSYSDDEINSLAAMMKDISIKSKPVLTEEIIKASPRATIDMLIALREMGKDKALMIVSEMGREK